MALEEKGLKTINEVDCYDNLSQPEDVYAFSERAKGNAVSRVLCYDIQED